MMIHPTTPMQLSFDFDFSSEQQITCVPNVAHAASLRATLRSWQAVRVEATTATIVSLCEMRKRREQQKTSQLYNGILASINHIG